LPWPFNSAIASPGGKDKSVRVWNAETGEAMAELKGHGNDITGLLFGPHNRRLLTASMDGTFKIWDISDGREVMTLQDSALESQNFPSVLANSSDWRRVVTITEPEAMQPFVLHSFPWLVEQYPGDDSMKLQDRIEDYKRSYWREVRERAAAR